MFLAEVALGKEHSITMDNWTLTEPPKGSDSIVARGRTEPGVAMHAICYNSVPLCYLQQDLL
jgi:poly [ADP-ribose] polymerase